MSVNASLQKRHFWCVPCNKNKGALYELGHKKRATLFSTITLAILGRLSRFFCTGENRNQCSTAYVPNGLMMS